MFVQNSPLSRMKFVISRKAWYVTECLIGMEQGGMVYLDVGGLEREAVVRITGFQNNCEVLSCVFGDLLWVHYAARS